MVPRPRSLNSSMPGRIIKMKLFDGLWQRSVCWLGLWWPCLSAVSINVTVSGVFFICGRCKPTFVVFLNLVQDDAKSISLTGSLFCTTWKQRSCAFLNDCYLLGQNFGGQNFRWTKFFGGLNFRHQVQISAVLSDGIFIGFLFMFDIMSPRNRKPFHILSFRLFFSFRK